MKKFVTLAVAVLAMAGTDVVAAAKNEPVTVRTTIILTAPLSAKEGDPLPADIRELALPYNDKGCGDLVLIPEMKFLRGDFADPKEIPILPGSDTTGSSLLDKFAIAVGKNPTVEALRNRIEPRIDSVHIAGDWIRPGDKAVSLPELPALPQIRDADLRLVLLGKSDRLSEADIRTAFPDLPENYLVKDTAALNQEIIKRLCSGGPEAAKGSVEGRSVAVIYKPRVERIGTGAETGTRKIACNESLLNQGIQFVSMALDKRDAGLRRSDYENAFGLFDRTVQEAQASNACCAKGLMNRGLVRKYLDEPNLALEDLKEAERCDSNDAGVAYNLASYYSGQRRIDYSLQSLDKALDKGFSNCHSLRADPDLTNVRASPRFRDLLEKHKLFCKL